MMASIDDRDLVLYIGNIIINMTSTLRGFEKFFCMESENGIEICCTCNCCRHVRACDCEAKQKSFVHVACRASYNRAWNNFPE